MEIEELQNEQSSGTDSGSANGGSYGRTDGRTGSADGSDGRTDRSDRGIDLNVGVEQQSSADSDGIDNSRRTESEPISDDGNVIRDSQPVNARASRAERLRGRRPVRLGARDRDSDADGGRSADAGTAEIGNSGNIEEPVIRLGATRQGAPKTVKPKDSSPKTKLDKDVRDLIKMFTESLFEIPAIALKQDFWRLSAEESKQLNDALIAWLASMPESDQSKIAEFVGKHMPVINLVMVAFFIVSDRVKASVAVYRASRDYSKFTEAVNNAPETPTSAGVRTAMDSIFNN